MVLRFIVYTLLMIPVSYAVSQDFSITRVERQSDDVIIHYNMVDTVANRSYTISLYASADDYINPLSDVEGDIGVDVPIGGKRKIIWHAKKELGEEFTGSMSLEIRGNIYIPFIRLDGFGDYEKFKRDKGYKITWTGGRGNQVLNFNLYKGDKKITTYPNVANVGQYNLKFENVKPGKGYYFKIEDIKNKDDLVVTETFKIKRKVPLILKIIPMLAVGYAVSFLANSENREEPIPQPITPD